MRFKDHTLLITQIAQTTDEVVIKRWILLCLVISLLVLGFSRLQQCRNNDITIVICVAIAKKTTKCCIVIRYSKKIFSHARSFLLLVLFIFIIYSPVLNLRKCSINGYRWLMFTHFCFYLKKKLKANMMASSFIELDKFT